jgi:phosphonopyruvate decarboxylase
MKAKEFVGRLSSIDINNFYGVPDSLMSSLSKYLELESSPKTVHKIMHNEGGAVGIAIGTYITKKQYSAVYLQNSGLGNIINPITSLTNSSVFGIPILYIIGWRGEPGTKDEPQHSFQGNITTEILDLLDIEYMVLESENDFDVLKIKKALSKNKSFALIIKKNFFDKNETSFDKNENPLHRQDVIDSLYKAYDENTFFVSTTGKTSRELYEITKSEEKTRSFFSIGGMGHASSIALGVAENTNHQVVCFDGDGALLMHMGSISIIGTSGLKNFHYLLLNNYSHESVGGQPTISQNINFELISKANNFDKYISIKTIDDLEEYTNNINSFTGSKIFVEIHVEMYSDKELPRPNLTPKEYLEKFK